MNIFLAPSLTRYFTVIVNGRMCKREKKQIFFTLLIFSSLLNCENWWYKIRSFFMADVYERHETFIHSATFKGRNIGGNLFRRVWRFC